MMSAHAIRGDRRYRYYVSRPAKEIAAQPWRLPAGDIEAIVTRELRQLLDEPLHHSADLDPACALVPDLAGRCRELASRIDQPAACSVQRAACRNMLRDLEVAISIAQDGIEIELSAAALAGMITGSATAASAERIISLSVPVSLRRRGHELRVVHAAPDAQPAERDDGLVQLLAGGRAAYDELKARSALIDSTRRSHLTRLARLRFLAPDIITAILDGHQPVELTSRSLLRIADLPLDWSGQRYVLGFA